MPVAGRPVAARRATNSCSKAGITSSALGPTPSGAIGTGRQPSTRRPSAAAVSATTALTRSRAAWSVGRNAMPVA